MAGTLPDGPTGRLLALALTGVVLVLAWAAAARPLLDWYADRAEQLETREALARRMAALVEALPVLRRDAATPTAGRGGLLEGATDAAAAAALQERVGDMAVRSGATPTSLEVLPARPRGDYSEIGVRVALHAPWPVLVRLLGTVAEASPRMLVDDLQLRAAPDVAGGADRPLDASLAVLAFRATQPHGNPPLGNSAPGTPVTAPSPAVRAP